MLIAPKLEKKETDWKLIAVDEIHVHLLGTLIRLENSVCRGTVVSH